jgi:Ca2+-binding EF-hand superfamily protein
VPGWPQDGSGSLDRDEVRTLVEMVGATFSEKELDAAMAELDPSGDGQVDFTEFKAYWVRPHLTPSNHHKRCPPT